MSWVQACPVEPFSGSCPEPLEWVELAVQHSITTDEFMVILPYIVAMLFASLAIRFCVRLIWRK